MITNSQSGTNVHEVADGIYRINTPVAVPGAGHFNFNQYLVLDDAPLLFHTGLRGLFPLVSEAVASLMPRRAASAIATRIRLTSASSASYSSRMGTTALVEAVGPTLVNLGERGRANR